MALSPIKRNAFEIVFPSDLEAEIIGPDSIASVQIPNVTFETAEHVEANHKVETPSLINVEDMEVVLYEDNTQRNNFFLTKLPHDQSTGALKNAADYKFDITIYQLGLDRLTRIRSFEIKAGWIKSSSHETSERTGTENYTRTYSLGVTSMVEAVL